MPLKKGKSRKTIGANIREIYEKYKRTGLIGGAKPGSRAKALRQAIAIALSTAGKKQKKKKAKRGK